MREIKRSRRPDTTSTMRKRTILERFHFRLESPRDKVSDSRSNGERKSNAIKGVRRWRESMADADQRVVCWARLWAGIGPRSIVWFLFFMFSSWPNHFLLVLKPDRVQKSELNLNLKSNPILVRIRLVWVFGLNVHP